MVTFLGLVLVGIISRGAVLMGVLAATFGLALSAIGIAPAIYEQRYTFDTVFLQDGLSVVIVALGLFGIPEMLHLVTSKQAVAKSTATGGAGRAGSVASAGLKQGAFDTVRNMPLVAGSSWMASLVAIIPGVGGSIVTWIAWTVAGLSKKKNKVPIGQGEIRGVIAPEAANNATDGGQLVPTLLFGIPASGGMALLLSGMTLMGVQGGPQLLEGDGLVLIVSIVLALVLANVLGTAVCFFIARWVSRLSFVPGRVIVPFLVVVLTLAAFQANDQLGFLFIMLAIGALGWIFVRLGIPRVPVLVGFVLGTSVERYLWISMSRFGTDWLLFPEVWVVCVFAILLAVVSVVLSRRASRTEIKMKWR